MSSSFATPWTIAHQAPLSMEFSRQEYWSGLPFPSPGDLPDPGIEPMSPVLACGFFTTEPPAKPKGVSLALLYRETEAVSFPYLLSDGTGICPRSIKHCTFFSFISTIRPWI
ncbi:unnamed protein product [Rangifer tarandus platyrhynchus]|uniref:Uncharacterized protein n=2 Tax=Rangifer tarandus platyrhynchus TaxID=3082113 RepID=A0AC59Y383_RANTA|nr:unnamed protein product [Rangifer tarandus platyrhynchus]